LRLPVKGLRHPSQVLVLALLTLILKAYLEGSWRLQSSQGSCCSRGSYFSGSTQRISCLWPLYLFQKREQAAEQ
jgi:hypothetical protein